MLTAHHVNAFLVIAVCVARVGRRLRGATPAPAGSAVAQLLALAQTLLVAQVALGLLLLSDHRAQPTTSTTPTARSRCSPCSRPGSMRRPSRGRASPGSACATLVAAALGVRAWMTA